MEPKKKSFFERNPDLEKFIGENLLNKIGIGILVLGIAYFLKYAFDMEYIRDGGKAITGLVSGLLMIGIAHRLHKKYKAFSSVLVGGGLAVFYFTVWIGFKEFALFDQTTAFILMIVTSGLSVFLSVFYDRQELAILSLLGGFGSPFLVSSGEGSYMVLFTYVAILNAGMLVLAYFKRWNSINLLAFLFSAVLYGGWLVQSVIGVEDAPLVHALIFGTIFYLEFFYMNIVNNVRKGSRFTPREIFMLISNTALYYSAGMYILDTMAGGQYQGIFTAAMALLHFFIALPLYRRKSTDRVLLFLLTGLVLSFLSLVAPVQLEKYSITLFWACEAVLLYWLFKRSGIKLLRIGSLLVTGLMIISMVMDWSQIYGSTASLEVIANRGFITSVVALISLGFTVMFLSREKDEFLFDGVPTAIICKGAIFLTAVMAYFTGLFELSFQLDALVSFDASRVLVLVGYHLAILWGLAAYSRRKGFDQVYMIISAFAGIFLFVYAIMNSTLVVEVRNAFLLEQGAGLADFIFHYLVVALLGGLLFQCRHYYKQLMEVQSVNRVWMYGIGVLALVFMSSAELSHVVVSLAYDGTQSIQEISKHNQQIGYPILWGICSFGLIVLGMRRRSKELRILALVLFTVTLGKLFIFDMRGISEGGRIAAFISLGVLLLVISFLYQKLKHLLFEDDAEEANDVEIASADEPTMPID